MRGVVAIVAGLVCACTSHSSASESWTTYKFDLSGRSFVLAVPAGQFGRKYVPQIDLATNEQPFLQIFGRSWIFPGLLADQGALELTVLLNRANVGHDDNEFLRGITTHYSKELRKLYPNGIELLDIHRKRMGGRDWLCYRVSKFLQECALKVDQRHYLSWRLLDINNTASQIDARDELRRKIAQSLEIAF